MNNTATDNRRRRKRGSRRLDVAKQLRGPAITIKVVRIELPSQWRGGAGGGIRCEADAKGVVWLCGRQPTWVDAQRIAGPSRLPVSPRQHLNRRRTEARTHARRNPD